MKERKGLDTINTFENAKGIFCVLVLLSRSHAGDLSEVGPEPCVGTMRICNTLLRWLLNLQNEGFRGTGQIFETWEVAIWWLCGKYSVRYGCPKIKGLPIRRWASRTGVLTNLEMRHFQHKMNIGRTNCFQTRQVADGHAAVYAWKSWYITLKSSVSTKPLSRLDPSTGHHLACASPGA